MGKVLFLRKGSVHTKPVALPSGYTKLEYIQSSGTQYIDTGVSLTTAISLTLDWQLVTYASDKWFLSALNTGTNQGLRIGAYENAFYLQNAMASQNADLTARTIFTGKSTYAVGLNLFLFAENRNGSSYGLSSGKLYSCQIYDNGPLIRDYIPCINASGAVGLYDLVDRQFYGNAGTGVFIGSEAA